MKTIDCRCSPQAMDILRAMIGKRLEKIRCDPFSFNNWVFMIVGIYVDDSIVRLLNQPSTYEYFGFSEDICNFTIEKVNSSEIRSGLDGVEQIDIPFGFVISKILVVNEEKKYIINDIPSEEFHTVHALIIIGTDGREIGFEKIDDLSEEIAILRGNDLVHKLIPPEKIQDEMEPNERFDITRTIVKLE